MNPMQQQLRRNTPGGDGKSKKKKKKMVPYPGPKRYAMPDGPEGWKGGGNTWPRRDERKGKRHRLPFSGGGHPKGGQPWPSDFNGSPYRRS